MRSPSGNDLYEIARTLNEHDAAAVRAAADELIKLRAQNTRLADGITLVVERVKTALRESTAEVLRIK